MSGWHLRDSTQAHIDHPTEENPNFEFRWNHYSSLSDGPLRSRAKGFVEGVDWQALLAYATPVRGGSSGSILSPIGLGYNHMVRIVEYDDGIRWVAGIRLPSLVGDPYPSHIATSMRSEHCTALLVEQKTDIPLPKVHAIETSHVSLVGAPFMLMDCLDGNVGMDLGMDVPHEYKHAFLNKLAEMQVALSTIQLPVIGTILAINDDGTYQQGPIPGIGGPFSTATELFRALAASAKFPMTEERLRAASGQFASEVVTSVSTFPRSFGDLATDLSICENGPFPLYHGDFGHNNIVVDDKYRVLGVIDWESAFAAPWEIAAAFPLTLRTIPPAMDVPWNYDENGHPKDAQTAEKYDDQKEYIVSLEKEEEKQGLARDGIFFSKVLKDSRRQHVLTAMSLYQGGKAGFYSKVIDQFRSREIK